MFKWKCPKCGYITWNSWKCYFCGYKHKKYKESK